jgi:hypothetical protein
MLADYMQLFIALPPFFLENKNKKKLKKSVTRKLVSNDH